MTIVAVLALCVAVAAIYWAHRAAEPSREILRTRAAREAAKARTRTPQVVPAAPRLSMPMARREAPDPFRDPPRSIASFSGAHARYVRQPTSSLDWAGAAWASPVALDFEQSTISAVRCGAKKVYVHERPLPPQQIIRDLEVMWHRLRGEIERAKVVVDANEMVGVTVGGDAGRDQGDLSVSVKCWPAVEGVTVPRQDRTL